MGWRNYSKALVLKIKIDYFSVFTVCFNCMLIWELSKYSETKLQTTCFYLEYRFFKKQNEVWIRLSPSFSVWFLKKNISPNFIVWLLLIREILSNMCIVIVC